MDDVVAGSAVDRLAPETVPVDESLDALPHELVPSRCFRRDGIVDPGIRGIDARHPGRSAFAGPVVELLHLIAVHRLKTEGTHSRPPAAECFDAIDIRRLETSVIDWAETTQVFEPRALAFEQQPLAFLGKLRARLLIGGDDALICVGEIRGGANKLV